FANSFESTFSEDNKMPAYLTAYNNDSQTFDLAQSPLPEPDSMSYPEVLSYGPASGSEGTKISISIQLPFDVFSNPTTNYFSLVVGNESCDCTVSPLGLRDSCFMYLLSTEAPSFGSTGSQSFMTSLQLMVAGYNGQDARVVPVGPFTYDNSVESSASSGERKRRISDASDGTRSPALRATMKHQRLQSTPSFSYSSESLAGSPYSGNLPTPASTVFSHQYQSTASPGPMGRQYTSNPSGPIPSIKTHSPLSSAWSPPLNDSKPNGFSHSMEGVGMSRHNSTIPSMHGKVGNSAPTLIRTSTIQQSLAGAAIQGKHGAFNPYMIYPHKAVLELNGNLDSMADNWTKEEIESKRRLVQFNRFQEGSTIHADFAPVTLAERSPSNICISCIYWEGKNECYVTSVDTIYLLESLVAVRFTVEEKNRIRRNLEGFRPLTVSKSRPESEDFFKVIMGFPAPKPRNIEKDVKVFPWKVLAHALKKIIGKYSASYASTAGNMSSMVSGYGNGVMNDTMSHDPRSASPAGPQTSNGIYTTHFPNMSTSRLASHARASSAISLASAASFDSCSPQPAHREQYLNAPDAHYPRRPYSFSYSPNGAGAIPVTVAPATRPNPTMWEFNSFVDTAPGTPEFVSASGDTFDMLPPS
ncbi:40S ribosomal protein S17, partial [Ascosphaera pollenicola]